MPQSIEIEEVNHKELESLIFDSYNNKIPMFIYGTFGIGKSETVLKVSKRIAEEKGKEFINWNEIDKKKREKVVNDLEGYDDRVIEDAKRFDELSGREKEMVQSEIDGDVSQMSNSEIEELNEGNYFLFIDKRVAQNDPSDIKGIPNLDSESVDWKPPLWVYAISRSNADGVVFLDELNLAPPSVQSSMYQLIHDRQSGNHSLSDDIGIMAAGNTKEDKSNTFNMSNALQDRMLEVLLKRPSIDDWLDWADKNDIDGRIRAYLRYKQDHLHKPNVNSPDKSATPRGWERASNLIEGKDNIREIRNLVASSVGVGIAREFISFLRTKRNLDLKQFINNPDTVELPEANDRMWSLISSLAEWYGDNVSKDNLRKMVKLAVRMEDEFTVLLMRLVKEPDEDHFIRHVSDIDEWEDIANEIRKYMI